MIDVTNHQPNHMPFSDTPRALISVLTGVITLPTQTMHYSLVVSTHLKILVKLDNFPRDRGENKKCLSCHHLEYIRITSNMLHQVWSPQKTGFANPSLETTLKNWVETLYHQGFPTTWKFLGLILSMVTRYLWWTPKGGILWPLGPGDPEWPQPSGRPCHCLDAVK